MKKLTSIIAIAFLMTLGFNAVADNNTATSNATASAKIMTPITINTESHLQFGTFSSTGNAGTVTIEASLAGTRTSDPSITLSALDNGGSASYTVTGEANATYVITLPSSITISDGTNSMDIDNFTSNHDENIGTLNASGSEIIFVGATINVDANQAAGEYSGSYDVTVSYN